MKLLLAIALLAMSTLAHAATSLFSDGFDPPPIACPAGRQEFSSISYGIYPEPTRPWVSLAQWENVWGAASATATIQLWPGPNSASPVFYLERTKYIAAKFHVPAGFATTKFGQYAHAPNPPGPNIDAAYSTRCGDFSPQPGTGCVATDWTISLTEQHLLWKVGSLNPSFCGLKPNTDYYLNIRFHDPFSSEQCGIGSQQCQVYLQHTHN
jgi:hypothetical protein